jgi:hypothetical protein
MQNYKAVVGIREKVLKRNCPAWPEGRAVLSASISYPLANEAVTERVHAGAVAASLRFRARASLGVEAVRCDLFFNCHLDVILFRFKTYHGGGRKLGCWEAGMALGMGFIV